MLVPGRTNAPSQLSQSLEPGDGLAGLAGGKGLVNAVRPCLLRHRQMGTEHAQNKDGKTAQRSPYFGRNEAPENPMRTPHRAAPADIGFLLDELRLAGVLTYADLAATLNRQGIKPGRGRWTAHALHLAMRRHRHAHPAASAHAGAALYARRAEEARRVIRRLHRRGLRTRVMIARALNARGLTTPGYGRPWTARSVSRVVKAAGRRARKRRAAKPTLR
jgi:hypothetical protein